MSDTDPPAPPTRPEIVDALRHLHWMCTTEADITVGEMQRAIDQASEMLERIDAAPDREPATPLPPLHARRQPSHHDRGGRIA